MGDYNNAEIILEGASFFCGKGLDSNIDFLAIRDNRIIGTGRKSDMPKYVGPKTVIKTYSKENLIMPGLHDNHVHLVQAGVMAKYVNLYDAVSRDDAAKRIAAFAKTIPDEEWILAVGFIRTSWEGDTSLPTKEDLDKYIADRPVLAFDDELHVAWLNSVGLEKCGITNKTPEPAEGIIERDENKNPTGCLLENAVALGAKYALDFDVQKLKLLVKNYLEMALRNGITSLSDMTPYLSLDLSWPEVYFEMAKKGELKVRINAARNLFEDINTFNSIRERAEKEGEGMYRVPFMKQFLDGTPANYTGFLLEEYSDCPGEKGISSLDPDTLNAAVEIATENNVSVRLHSCGDASCRLALDTYENGLKKYPHSKSRHMVEHLELVSPEDIPRFGSLGVIASIQPEHLAAGTTKWSENCYPDRLGKIREKYTWPFKSVKDAGAVLAGGSDCPVVEGNPFWGMYVGTSRKFFDDLPEGGWNPQEKLTIEDMIDMYTWGASYAEGREKELGTIEVGKLADITVVDRNLLNMAENTEIRDVNVLLTMVNGQIVYEK
jgi:predicted amidohydrolase YtcJ